ncbi:MAG: hypothetical protein PHP82_04080 [Candidatus ainarchaeum sp.]|nr:hypothetical protein [Candidatus ainarchaeum sp.]
MKKILFFGIFLIISLSFAFADIIPPDSHPVEKCVTINNIDLFDEYVIIGKITGPMINDTGFEIVELVQNVCLNKGYKFNKFMIYAITKNYFEEADVIDFNSANVFPSNIEIDPYGGYTSNFDSTTKIEIILTIKEITDNQLILETISEIKTPTQNITTPNFFESIICFFKSLFGMSC